MSKIYLELLNKKRREVFTKLSAFKRRGYLAGGTALALQINHRKSVDFDIFIARAVDNRLRLKIRKIFGRQDFYVNTSDQISFNLEKDVGVTFVWYYYKPLYSLIRTSSLSLASVFDIAADKAHTIGQRAVWRDYVDLFFLLREKRVVLQEIIKLAQKKFAGEFNEVLFLQQLTFFKDIKISTTEFIREEFTFHQIRSFLEDEVRKYLRKVRKI